MSVRDCITSAMEDGHISRDAGPGVMPGHVLWGGGRTNSRRSGRIGMEDAEELIGQQKRPPHRGRLYGRTHLPFGHDREVACPFGALIVPAVTLTLCRALFHGKADYRGDHSNRKQNPVELHRGRR